MIHQIIAVICSLKQTKRNLAKRKMQTERDRNGPTKEENDDK